jgi:phosphate transport system permease protein
MRRAVDRMLTVGAGFCAALAVGVIVLIVLAIFWRGGSALSWQFLTEQIRLVGAAGGVFYNVVGTLILVGTALVVSAPISTGVALVHSVYLPSEQTRRRLWWLLSAMNGVPSILFGLFGLIVFVKFFGWGKSWLTGGILLGVMILPIVAVSLIERIEALPRKYVEAAASLGLRQSQIVWSVILPQCGSGWVTGTLLGLARAAGETAPIMFTATIFAGATLPHGIRESPVLTLPYHIFILSQDSFDPAVGAKVWGAALVLLGLVLVLSLAALPARLKIHYEAQRG